MEKSRKDAIEALVECIEKLEKTVPGALAEAPMTLHAVTPFPQVLQTTFGREVRVQLWRELELVRVDAS